MTVLGVLATNFFDHETGTIGADAIHLTAPPEGKETTFPKPTKVLAIPVIFKIGETSDQSIAHAFVQEFNENFGPPIKGPFFGVASDKCTRIVWGLRTSNCFASAMRLIFFLD
jgi:hypothetical protein